MVDADFAEAFLRDQTNRFRKDLAVCLRGIRRKYHGNGRLTHAYFPAFMSCLSFLEFLSGFYAGDIEAFGAASEKQIHSFASAFLDRNRYSSHIINILWKGFRNKIAHLAHAYYVFDTSSVSGIGMGPLRITWTISERQSDPHLLLESKAGKLRREVIPLTVPYDHILHVSLPVFRNDLLRAATMYSGSLRGDANRFDKFEKALKIMFALETEGTDVSRGSTVRRAIP